MAILKYTDVGIHSVSACVPQKVVRNSELDNLIPKADLEKTIHSIGIRERRIAERDVCSSDLCSKAAERLLSEHGIDRDSIGALIFISQTPDYRQPSTAPSLQDRLGLPKTVMAFDINMACSGYVYGLSIAYSLASQDGIGRVLLLVGETMSKTVSDHDKVTTPLFGDAGTATLIEKGDGYGPSCFVLHSDGGGSDMLRVPYGGYRNPSSTEGFERKVDEEGNILSGEQLHMRGMDVFNFGLRVVPSGIKEILKVLGMGIEDVDIIHFHQANRFMTDFFAKKLRFPLDRVPYSLGYFGNTSAASIPLNMVHTMYDGSFPRRRHVLMAGFGAGLAWGTASFLFPCLSISIFVRVYVPFLLNLYVPCQTLPFRFSLPVRVPT